MIRVLLNIGFCCLLLVNGLAKDVEKVPNLFDDVSKLMKDKKTVGMYTRQATIHNCFELKVKDIKYIIGVNFDHQVEFISTEDLEFKSPEGFWLGTTKMEMESAIGKGIFRQDDDDRYWFTKLPSGWCAAFVVRDPETKKIKKPESGDKITFFFKFDIYYFYKLRMEKTKGK